MRAKLKAILLLGIMCFTSVLQAQEATETLKQRQRAIFIFNFAQQVGWQNLDALKAFSIGVLGTDPVLRSLDDMSKKRKLFGKPVTVKRFTTVNAIKNIQLLYVNKHYNYDLKAIKKIISGKQILLVTENYNFNTSMINMLRVDDAFQYEVNLEYLKKEHFAIAPSLQTYAISSEDKWKALYKSTQSSLKKTKANIKAQDVIIQKREKEIEGIFNEVENKDLLIKSLADKTAIQSKQYEEKVEIERVLEQRIQQQLDVIKGQKEAIAFQKDTLAKRNAKIEKQTTVLQDLEKDIEAKLKTLEQKNSQLANQKQFIALLILLVIVVLAAVFLIYRSFLLQKKLRTQLEDKNVEIVNQSKKLFNINTELREKNTRIQEQTKALEVQNNELEQFAYIASHDLQEPLSTISSFIGILKEDYQAHFDETGKQSLNYISDASKRMKQLISALLDYSRLGRSKNFTEVNCNRLLVDLKADLKHVIERTNANVQADDLPEIIGSEVELRLLFQNLISNAIKFIKPDVVPNVEISCTTRKATSPSKTDYLWQFAVKDNGIGIPKAQQKKVFEIFQRLHSREHYKGTGIGLAHCKKIVESHGGDIWLESAEGQGTTFYFTIPKYDIVT